MVSSAFSRKKFDTKAPAICIPPPWPPFLPPPPLPAAIFYCFASFKHTGWPNVPIHANSCHLYYRPTIHDWYGRSKQSGTSPFIHAQLYITGPGPGYRLIVGYQWPGVGGTFVEWTAQSFSQERPYVGATLTQRRLYYDQVATANLREVPV